MRNLIKWKDSELKQALQLYNALKNPQISISEAISQIEALALKIGRSYAAVSMRLANYKYLDTDGREGLSNGGPNLRNFWDKNKEDNI